MLIILRILVGCLVANNHNCVEGAIDQYKVY